MAEISAKTVMELRGKTNAGMMDCKKALAESNGDMDKAEDILRKKGITKMENRVDRVSKEGIVHSLFSSDGKSGVLIEVNCETDFVSKNEAWRGFVNDVATHTLNSTAETLGAVLAEPYSMGRGTVDEAVKAKGAETGEVTILRRFVRYVATPGGAIHTYLHMGGRIGVMLEVSSGNAPSLDKDEFKELLKDLALQITAANPAYLTRSDVPETAVAKEKAIYAESDRLKGKPAAALEGILNGMIGKYFSQICLLEQGYIKDQDKTVEDIIKAAGAALGDTLTVKRFSRFAVGEEFK